MKKKLYVILFFLIAFSLLIFGYMYKISSVTVNSLNEAINDVDIEEQFLGRNYIVNSESSLVEQLLSTGFVEEAEVHKVFPSAVDVVVKWKEPVVAVKTANNYALLSNDGYVIGISKGYKGYDVVRGVIVKSAILGNPIVTSDDDTTIGAVNLLIMMKINQNIFAGGMVYPNIEVKDGDIIHVISDKYWINFGNYENLDKKLVKAASIYNFNYEKGVKTGIINVSIENHEVYQIWKN